jgi:predicted AAA+ superfamily ATPase
MYPRTLEPPARSFLLLGPRGTGKSTWLRHRLPGAVWFDLLDADLFLELSARPGRLGDRIPADHVGWVVVDEVQRVPALLDEVHRLLEARPALRFALTGSSARKLRRGGVNLLGGRALPLRMHPLTADELGGDWDLVRALSGGTLPVAWTSPDPVEARRYLEGYVGTYLREEVQHEALTRNLAGFARFLEAASLSQAAPLNMAAVAADCGVDRRVVQGWFEVLEDLLLAVRLPVFTRRARRATTAHPKFFYFDVGVYRAVRPRGPLDAPEEIDGAALETLLLQHARALGDTLGLGYEWSFWRTRSGEEVDLVAYGERGLLAFEVKRTDRLRPGDLRGLRAFVAEYPMARAFLLYGGDRVLHDDGIDILPLDVALRGLRGLLESGGVRQG